MVAADSPKRLFIITGDHSGDVHAANVVRHLKELYPAIEVAAVGGEALRAQGVELLEDQSRMGQVGLGSFWSAPYHYFLGQRIVRFLDGFQPDAVLHIDYGVFNLAMAKALKRRGHRCFYFIPPQVWASRRGRIEKIRASIDHVFCIFPFEEELYRSEGIPVTYVGHPLVGQLPPAVDKADFCREHGLDPGRPLIGVFPGSRRMEIRYLLRPILESLPLIRKQCPDAQFVVAKAASLPADWFDRQVENCLEKLPDSRSLDIKILEGKNHAVMSAADALIMKSGTGTLEGALYKKPMVILYKGHPVAAFLARRLTYLPCFGLPNILTDVHDPAVPELLQEDATPEKLAKTFLPMLDMNSTPAQKAMAAYELIHAQLAKGDAPRNLAIALLRETGVELAKERHTVS